MAELVVEGEQLVVRLSWWEKIAAAHGNVRVPLSSVSHARVQARARGFLRYGSIVSYGRRSRYFAAARGRRPAVQVSLHPPSRFSWLLVTVADPEATATRIMDARDRHRRAAVVAGSALREDLDDDEHGTDVRPGQMPKFTASVRWDYTVAELRQIAAGHDLRVTSRMRHDDLVSLITEAGISLPPKPLEQLPPYLRRGRPKA